MTDDARRSDVGCGVNDRSDDPLDRNVSRDAPAGIDAFKSAAGVLGDAFEEVPPGDTVLGGQHHGAATINLGEIAGHIGDLMGLHGKNDEILLAGLGEPVGGGYRGGDFAFTVDELQPVRLDRFKMAAAGDDRHLLACGMKLGRKQSADRPCAHHTNAHHDILNGFQLSPADFIP